MLVIDSRVPGAETWGCKAWESQQRSGLGKPGAAVGVGSLGLGVGGQESGVWSQVRLDASDKDFLPVR